MEPQPREPGRGGFSLELASQALAATGSKSTLKATEWILKNRRAADQANKANPENAVGKSLGGSQSKLDLFFQAGHNSNPPPNPLQLRQAPDDNDRLSTGLDLNDSESNTSGTRDDDDGGEHAPSPHHSAAITAGTGGPGGTGGGSARQAGNAGGFDLRGFDSRAGASVGWRSGNSVRMEQEGLGSSGYGGGGGGGGGGGSNRPPDDNPRFSKAKGGSVTLLAREEDPVSYTKAKRALLGQDANLGGGSSSAAPKRQKYFVSEGHGSSPIPAPTLAPALVSPAAALPLAPIFTSLQSMRFKQQQQQQQQQREHNAAESRSVGRSLAPLAERMRPVTVDDVVGQDKPRQFLRTLLDNETVPSIILFGPPGTGKTSLARAIASSLPGFRFVGLSAVHCGTKEVKGVLDEASKQVKRHGKRTLLFLDEVHRFNKAQQDLFLPAVEAGSIVFIGATTENPSFEINAALLSRCRVLSLCKLEPESLRKVLERAIVDREKGVLASLPECATTSEDCDIRVEEEALTFVAGAADGDARVALNAIELATSAAYSEAKLQSGTRTRAHDVAGTVPTCRTAVIERVASGSNLVVTGKKDLISPSLFASDRVGNGFGSKRLEALIENAMDCAQSNEDYTKPFKRFVGGKEITPLHNPARFDREVVSISAPDGGVVGRGAESSEANERKLSNPDAIVPDGGGRVDMNARGEAGLLIRVTLVQVREAFQRSHVLYDKTGEEHYNIISALHKSMRGGDADAAIYWLARMLEGGEGPLYVARRLIRFASEDVGLADPHAMGVAVACYQACHFLGMPECNVNLAQCVVYLAYAPKSVVVYQAIEAAQRLVRDGTQMNEPVPHHLRNAPTTLMKEMGYGVGYIYPPGHAGRVEQEYMPPSLHGHKFLQWPQQPSD